ncbi:MAG: MFS transporter [Trueperaceae bacterium]
MKALGQLGNGLRNTFFGWWVVGGSILLQILIAGLLMQAYGTYVAVWRAEFGWSKTTFATAFAVQRAQMAVLSPVQGWLLKRFGSRGVIQVGLVLLAVGFVLLSQVNSVPAFYGTFLVLALGVGLAGFLSVTTTVVNWFERRRSSALALMQMGISIGGLTVPAIAWALTTFGWRPTAVASGVLILVVGLPVTALMRSSPEAYGLRPYGAKPKRAASERAENDTAGLAAVPAPDVVLERGFSARQALRTRAFWFITFGHASAVTIVAAVLVHLVVHLQESVGLTLQLAATMVAIMTAATMAGQLAGGVLGDRFNKRMIAVVAMLAHAVALLALTYADGVLWVLFFAIVHGLAWGMRGPVMQSLRADYFGRNSFATIMGISFSFVMLGQMAGPLLAGILADATGDYRLGFVLLAAFVASASLFFVFATPPRRPVG